MKVIIIGGVAGGASAAARLRRLDETAEIILLERSGYISYANCGLPYYIGGVIREKGALSVQTPESFGGRFRIDVRVKNEAVSIDPKEKTVRIRKLETGEEYVESYDRASAFPRREGDPPGASGHRGSPHHDAAHGGGHACDPGLSGGKEAEAGGGRGRRLYRAGDGGEPDEGGDRGHPSAAGKPGPAAAGL